MTGIEMPMELKDIPRFEKQNNISVSLYGWKKARINKDKEVEPGYAYTLRIAEDVKLNHVNLLMIGDEVKYYCWVKNFSRLVSAQYTGAKVEHAYCRFFLHGVYGKAIPGQCTRLEDAKRRRDEHEKECFQPGGQKTAFPDDPCVRFTSIEKQVTYLLLLFQLQISRPYTIYSNNLIGWRKLGKQGNVQMSFSSLFINVSFFFYYQDAL